MKSTENLHRKTRRVVRDMAILVLVSIFIFNIANKRRHAEFINELAEIKVRIERVNAKITKPLLNN